MRTRLRLAAGLAVALLVVGATACSGDDEGPSASVSDGNDVASDLGDPGDCVVVDMAVSPEKIDLMTDLARAFNGSDAAELDGGRAPSPVRRPRPRAWPPTSSSTAGTRRPRAPARWCGRRRRRPGARSSTSG